MDTNEVLNKCSLFKGIKDIPSLLKELGVQTKKYKAGALVKETDSVVELMIILEGSASIYTEDKFGNRSMMNKLKAGDIFGGAHSFAGIKFFKVNFEALEDTAVLSIKKEAVERAVSTDSKVFITNALTTIAKKCLFFLEKSDILSKRSIRAKVMAYLSSASEENGSLYFDIPFNRQEMADYLGVDRSALSIELSRMKSDGLIDYSKNHFRILSATE